MSLSDCVCSMGTVLDQAASAFDNRQTTEAQQSDHFNKVRELHRQKANMASIVKEGAIDDTKARARLDAINQELAQLPDPNVSKGWLNKAMATQEANRSSSLGRDIQQHRSTIDRRKESRDYSLLEQTQEPSTQNMGQEKRRANALSGACKSSAEATRRTGGILVPNLKPHRDNQSHAGSSGQCRPAADIKCISCGTAMRSNTHCTQAADGIPICATCRDAQSARMAQTGTQATRGSSRVSGMSAPAASAGISDADFYCTSVSGKPAGKPPLTLQPIAGPGKAAPPLRKRQLRAGPPKAPKAPPPTIELLSDEDAPGPSGDGWVDEPPEKQRRTSGRTTRSTAAAETGTAERFKGLRMVYPPAGGRGSVEVLPEDLARLDDEEDLNDTIIDFYLKFLMENMPVNDRGRVHFFNSFFYTKIGARAPSSGSSNDSASRGQRNFESVRRWTQHVDIFDKDFIMVPIHYSQHWSLLIICHPGAVFSADKKPCMILLDSLSGCHPVAAISKAVREYLQHEWDRKIAEGADSVPVHWQQRHSNKKLSFTGETIPAARLPSLPQQDNFHDCGLFVLAYADYFLYYLPGVISHKTMNELKDRHSFPLFFSKDWFEARTASALRAYLRHMILKDMNQQTHPDLHSGSHAEAVADIDEYEHCSDHKYLRPHEGYIWAWQRQEQLKQDAATAEQRKSERQQEKQPAALPKRDRGQDPQQMAADAALKRQRTLQHSSDQAYLLEDEDLEIDIDEGTTTTQLQQTGSKAGSLAQLRAQRLSNKLGRMEREENDREGPPQVLGQAEGGRQTPGQALARGPLPLSVNSAGGPSGVEQAPQMSMPNPDPFPSISVPQPLVNYSNSPSPSSSAGMDTPTDLSDDTLPPAQPRDPPQQPNHNSCIHIDTSPGCSPPAVRKAHQPNQPASLQQQQQQQQQQQASRKLQLGDEQHDVQKVPEQQRRPAEQQSGQQEQASKHMPTLPAAARLPSRRKGDPPRKLDGNAGPSSPSASQRSHERSQAPASITQLFNHVEVNQGLAANQADAPAQPDVVPDSQPAADSLWPSEDAQQALQGSPEPAERLHSRPALQQQQQQQQPQQQSSQHSYFDEQGNRVTSTPSASVPQPVSPVSPRAPLQHGQQAAHSSRQAGPFISQLFQGTSLPSSDCQPSERRKLVLPLSRHPFNRTGAKGRPRPVERSPPRQADDQPSLHAAPPLQSREAARPLRPGLQQGTADGSDAAVAQTEAQVESLDLADTAAPMQINAPSSSWPRPAPSFINTMKTLPKFIESKPPAFPGGYHSGKAAATAPLHGTMSLNLTLDDSPEQLQLHDHPAKLQSAIPSYGSECDVLEIDS